MKNIWRDYWKGQTYNASALGTLFPIRTTSGCFIMINLSNYIQWFLIKAQYDFATFTLQAYNITTIKESKGTIKEKDIVV